MTVRSREWGCGSPGFTDHMHRLIRFGLVAAALLGAAAAHADLVIFEDGRVVKAASYRVLDDDLEINLHGGGSYLVDLARVERIVEDEVEIAEVAVELPPPPVPVAYDFSFDEKRKPGYGSPYDALILAEAKRQDLDAALVAAVIRAESNFQPRAVSRKGARGLMQLMPATARRLDVRRPFDPVANLRGGIRYLKELLKRFDNRPELVLAAYNAGERAVETYGGVPPYRETVGYVKKILSWWTPAIAATVAPGPASPTGIAATSSPASK